jgi:hypothetical protein
MKGGSDAPDKPLGRGKGKCAKFDTTNPYDDGAKAGEVLEDRKAKSAKFDPTNPYNDATGPGKSTQGKIRKFDPNPY